MDDKKDGDVVIVHLSDLHLRGKDDSDAKIVIKALIEDLEAERSKQTNDFDLIVFSGDLVHAGGISDQFSDAKTEFIDKLLAATDTPRSRFVSCPGNHDIDRNAARDEPWVENGLKQHLNTRLAINDFIDRHINIDIFGSLPSPLKRMQHFYRSVWAEPSADCIMQCPFVSVFSFETKGQTIGVAAFNTAWRATGEADDRDKGNLILGERVVDHALEHLKQVNIRLAVFHHPLSWLHPSDQAAVDGRLQAEFDFLLCGHIHQASPEVRRSPAGQAILSQGSSLYVSREYFNGYNIIRLQNAEEKAEIAIQEYSDQRRKFVSATRIVEGGHIDYPFACRGVRAVARLTKMLQVVKPVIKQLANEHISKLVSAGTQLDIEHHFVCPSLSALSQASAQIDDAIFQKEPESNLLESALASLKSIAIIGRPESGKTSLAHHIATVVANGLADSSRLPLICKFSELRLGERSFWRLVRSYATEISDGSITREFVESEQVFVIVDDVNLFDEARIEILQAFVKARTNVRWALIVGSPATLVNVDALAHKYFSEFDIYTIRELSRRAIRALSANWIKSKTDDDDAEELYRNVMEQIRRTGLPRSGYIISLILWTMRNKSRGELLNEAVLIQNIIDYMLGRMDYTGRSGVSLILRRKLLCYNISHFILRRRVRFKRKTTL